MTYNTPLSDCEESLSEDELSTHKTMMTKANNAISIESWWSLHITPYCDFLFHFLSLCPPVNLVNEL